MPIPNDPLGRDWIEVSGTSPALVEQFRPTLVAFLAFDRDRVPSLAGTGFIIAGLSDLALIITAKHVLSEGVMRIQRPTPRHAPSALFVTSSSTIPSLSPERLKVAWMGTQSAGLLNVVHASYNDSTDLACCVVTLQELDPPPFAPMSVPLQTTSPTVGDVVQMVTLDGMDVTELTVPFDHTGKGQEFRVTRRVSIRIGTVTAVYPTGYRQYSWPCFTTSIPAEPGMSGGFVYLPVHGTTVAACGVVCADNSTDEARASNFLVGESVVACAWPSLALRVPITIPSAPTSGTRTLLEMVVSGDMDPPVGGVDHIRVVSLSDGNCVIKNQGQ